MVETGLKDKTVLITGASGGIGSVCAKTFAKEKANLVLHGYQNMNAIQKLHAELKVDTLPVRANLTDEEETKRLFNSAHKEFGAVDVLVANAGIWPEENLSIVDMSLERWNKTIETDLTSVFLCSREFFRSIEKTQVDSPSLVVIGSTAALFGEAGHADYSAAKAGVAYGLTKTLKNEIVRYAKKGRVNAVCPGWTKTSMAKSKMDGKAVDAAKLRTRSLKEIARPEDIANAVLYLSSTKLAGHVTGEILTVSGGMEGRVIDI